RRSLADDEVELEVFHRWIEDLLHRRVQPVDLVDEQHVARLEVGEQRGQVAGPRDHWTRRHAKADAKLTRHDLRQRRLAEPGGTAQEDVVEGIASGARRGDEYLQIVA